MVPLRGGHRREDLPFERKTPGGCSDSADRRPPGYRGCESKRGDDRCAQGNKHGSSVFVHSNQITGARKTHGENPQAPAAATNPDPLLSQSRSVSPGVVLPETHPQVFVSWRWHPRGCVCPKKASCSR